MSGAGYVLVDYIKKIPQGKKNLPAVPGEEEKLLLPRGGAEAAQGYYCAHFMREMQGVCREDGQVMP